MGRTTPLGETPESVVALVEEVSYRYAAATN